MQLIHNHTVDFPRWVRPDNTRVSEKDCSIIISLAHIIQYKYIVYFNILKCKTNNKNAYNFLSHLEPVETGEEGGKCIFSSYLVYYISKKFAKIHCTEGEKIISKHSPWAIVTKMSARECDSDLTNDCSNVTKLRYYTHNIKCGKKINITVESILDLNACTWYE